jgi:probable rRNA maturation factor
VRALAFVFTNVVIAHTKLNGVSEQALSRFVSRASRAAGLEGRVQVLLTDDAEMRRLNRQFRRKDKPTDVLSFPALPGIDGQAGDIAISVDIASDNAERLGHVLAAELKILILHGMLHLAGYDHESDNGQMARTEHKLRSELKLPDGLIARSSRPAQNGRRKR